jgi:hypothetical protein
MFCRLVPSQSLVAGGFSVGFAVGGFSVGFAVGGFSVGFSVGGGIVGLVLSVKDKKVLFEIR